YTTAGVIRFNNTSAYNGCLGTCSPIGYMSAGPGGFRCFNGTPTTTRSGSGTYVPGTPVPCLSSSYYDVKAGATLNPTWTSSAAGGPLGFALPGTPAAKAGATWDSLWAGNATGSYNAITPRFTNASLSDQFRPNDRFLINASIRYDNFTYDMPNSATSANEFYANMTANYTCVLAATNEVLTQPLAPGAAPPAATQYVNGNCDTAATKLNPAGPHTGWVHPNGTTQNGVAAPNFTATSPNSYSLDYWEPRFSATFTQSPDVVWRLSAGRFTQPPITASVQYTSLSGDDRSVWNNTMNLGFYSPFHPIPGISSGQYDLSYEQHFRGTDMSFKLTPFYTWVSNWQQQTFIGAGFVTQVPVGVNRNQGVEFQFNKGDFTRNGLSGQLAFTYTNSKVMFQNIATSTGGTITNELVALNQVIAAYNSLTKSGGGSPCYQGLNGVACNKRNSANQDTILNPYYNQPAQGLLNTSGWYNPYSTAIAPNLNAGLGSYISPIVSSLILNYRHDKLAITPSFSFQNGGYYGSPLDTNGLDPRACQYNSAANPFGTGKITKVSPKTNPLQCNVLFGTGNGLGQFGYFYIPDPQTGSFLFDNYQQPSSIVGNLQVAYDVSPTIRVTLLGANLFHSCFGGSTAPWTTANPPSNVVCGYAPAGGNFNSSLYPSNFYNGTGIGDRAANHATTPFTQSYQPSSLNNGAIGGAPAPINLYINAQVKI
ncbi:MAG: TonB-dependent receptor, partial [Candidatus Cybelea sp.]